MTFVGKILVIVIMAFSLLFLGISSVVYTASKNWVAATRDEQKKAEELKKKVQDYQAISDASKKGLEDAKVAYAAEIKSLSNRLAEAEAEHQRDLQQAQATGTQLASALQAAESTLQEVEAKREQTNLLRTQLSAAEKQGNEFKLRQAELNDRIRDLERIEETAKKNNTILLDQVARYSTLLRRNGLSDDITQIKGLESPPPVTGEVTRIDATNRRLELTIGSDDGLVVGHELFVYRTKPRPEYIGKVVIVAVEPDTAVAKVVGRTYQGKKIKEGDIVSSTIKPEL
jgi:hypothetical protein